MSAEVERILALLNKAKVTLQTARAKLAAVTKGEAVLLLEVAATRGGRGRGRASAGRASATSGRATSGRASSGRASATSGRASATSGRASSGRSDVGHTSGHRRHSRRTYPGRSGRSGREGREGKAQRSTKNKSKNNSKSASKNKSKGNAKTPKVNPLLVKAAKAAVTQARAVVVRLAKELAAARGKPHVAKARAKAVRKLVRTLRD